MTFGPRIVGFAMVLFAVTVLAAAQDKGGRVTGRVSDPAGAVLADVTIVLTGVDVNATYTARTDTDGRYDFPRVVAGAYRIDIRYPDVVPVTDVLIVQAGGTLTSDIGTMFKVELGLALRGASADALRRWLSGGPSPSTPLEWDCTVSSGPGVRPVQPGTGRDGAVPAVKPVMPLLVKPPPDEFALGAIVGLDGSPGIVQITGLIGSDGLPSRLIVNSATSPTLAAAALTAVLQMRWEAARWREVPVISAMTMEIRF